MSVLLYRKSIGSYPTELDYHQFFIIKIRTQVRFTIWSFCLQTELTQLRNISWLKSDRSVFLCEVWNPCNDDEYTFTCGTYMPPYWVECKYYKMTLIMTVLVVLIVVLAKIIMMLILTTMLTIMNNKNNIEYASGHGQITNRTFRQLRSLRFLVTTFAYWHCWRYFVRFWSF